MSRNRFRNPLLDPWDGAGNDTIRRLGRKEAVLVVGLTRGRRSHLEGTSQSVLPLPSTVGLPRDKLSVGPFTHSLRPLATI